MRFELPPAGACGRDGRSLKENSGTATLRAAASAPVGRTLPDDKSANEGCALFTALLAVMNGSPQLAWLA